MSPHFKREEFKCKCGNCDFIAVDHELLVVLEDLRSWFAEPVTINSANRCKDHNTAIGGHPLSKHMSGIAADIKIRDVTPTEVYNYLDRKYPNKYGIGLYLTFTHIDVQPTKKRWQNV